MRALLIGLCLALPGCGSGPQGLIGEGLGAGAGAGAGALLAPGKPLAAAGGAALGVAGVAAVGHSMASAYQQGLDDGYLIGSSDAVKRLYWAKQALERRTEEPAAGGPVDTVRAYDAVRDAPAPSPGGGGGP